MTLNAIPRVRMAQLPTPVHPLERLTAEIGGPELWIKRDDLTGLAFGGNKVRKLEFLVGDALEREADTLITGGAVQSNHCRQTAAAAARFGLECMLVLEGTAPVDASGNVLLDQLLGAGLIWADEQDLAEVMKMTASDSERNGRQPYVIPFGGSNAIGSVGYTEAMWELLDQGVEVDRIVVAITSGGTSAGLLAGARIYGYGGEITCIRIGRYRGSLLERLAEHARETAALLGKEIKLSPAEIDVRENYSKPGYGVVTDLERKAIRTFAVSEGVLLDPVYTGRAAGGMLDLISRGEISSDERVLFWHTGGTPALFAYGDELLI